MNTRHTKKRPMHKPINTGRPRSKREKKMRIYYYYIQ